ncbi:MAG: YggS family pyridoxal phosphate-dependent enzyme [Coriobacteriia bacterium]|nr:YggS family pyridoxal phosphate-dependent enzyme [Coriobacteriia bacterium]
MSTATRYQNVRSQLDQECERAGRASSDVLLLAVSKTVDVDSVAEAISAGAHAFGENRPDELMRKKAAFPNEQWHFIGNIQSRRIKDIVSAADLIHSVCKLEHLAKIDAQAKAQGKRQAILLEVNVSGEESKSGFSPEQMPQVLRSAAALENIELKGLMTMAPRSDALAIEETFGGLAKLRDELSAFIAENGWDMTLSELSMGMSEDWPRAVRYGSTIVRVGRAIFDPAFD